MRVPVRSPSSQWGGLDLNSSNSGCARLGSGVAPSLGFVKEEVAVLIVLVRWHRRAIGACLFDRHDASRCQSLHTYWLLSRSLMRRVRGGEAATATRGDPAAYLSLRALPHGLGRFLG